MLCKGRECPHGKRLRAQEGECHSLKASPAGHSVLITSNGIQKGQGRKLLEGRMNCGPRALQIRRKGFPCTSFVYLFVCFFRTNYYVTEDDFGLLNPLPPPVEITGICHYT